MNRDPPIPPRCNVLALDGGGVRGLSSLLILQDLMKYINVTIRDEKHANGAHEDVEPHDVFDFVAGTSTGGLIAIMLGKLGMTLEECIHAYHDLSKNIFGKKHVRGRITHGLAPTKYSGSRLERRTQDLIRSKNFEVKIPMTSVDDSDKIACAVVCREHVTQSKYSDIKRGAVPICSLPCHEQVACLVSEAARATSAAPTFFPVQKIGKRYFVDGGMEYNNPSQAIFSHYTEYNRVAGSRGIPGDPGVASPAARHGDLDFSKVRFVNLGTGTKSQALAPRQRDRLALLVPGFIRMTLFLKRTLTEFAVNSENIADHMRLIAYVSTSSGGSVDVAYERFSADNGVCYIKMDKYRELDRIRTLTSQYLKKPAIQARLMKVGKEIGRDYVQKHYPGRAAAPTLPDTLHVPDPNAAFPKLVPSQMPENPEHSTEAPASTDSSSECIEGNTQTRREPLVQNQQPDTNPTVPIPYTIGTGRLPAGEMLRESKTMTNSRTVRA